MVNYLPYLIAAYSTYLVGASSPGPANLSIMQTAMNKGRRPGLALAIGVVAGSITWGICVALGLAGLLQKYPNVFLILKTLGGCYFLWLAYRSIRSSFRGASSIGTKATMEESVPIKPYKKYFLQGLGIHLTNPKAIFVWIGIIALGMPPEAPSYIAPLIVAGCAFLGMLIFTTYALVFSTQPMVRLYISIRRPFDLVIGLFFIFTGTKLLFPLL